MATIQSPPIPNTETAISAFSIEAKEAFKSFLEANPGRYRITKEKKDDILSWVKNDLRVAKTQHHYNQRGYALRSFRYNAEKDMLVALPSNNCLEER